MKRTALAVLTAALAAVAAVSIASAAAPTSGRLIVSNPDLNVGANGAIHLVSIEAPGTFRTTIYVPAGYRAPGGLGAVGNQVGKAEVYATQADGSRITLNGQLSVVNKTEVPQTQCESSTGTHAAVWMLKANQTNGTGTITFPIYVDTAATNPNVPVTASYALQFCAADRGLTVSEVDLDLVKMFVNPDARGMYLWRGVYDPSTSGTNSPQSQSVGVVAAVPVDAQVTMHVSRVRSRKGWYTFTGNVTAVQHPLGNVKVQLFVGHSRTLALNRARATVRTKADGSYRVTLRLTGKAAWYARAKASTPYQDITAGGGCASVHDTLAAKTCVDATLSPFIVLTEPLARIA